MGTFEAVTGSTVHLRLQDLRWRDGHAEVLARGLSNYVALESLNLSGNILHSTDQLAKALPPKLDLLDLRRNELDPAAIETMAQHWVKLGKKEKDLLLHEAHVIVEVDQDEASLYASASRLERKK